MEGPDQVDTLLIFLYLAESRGTSSDFVTEMEKKLLDHASAAALECSDSSSLKIYRLAFPADKTASDMTTCKKSHRKSKSCWVLQTRIYVTSDRQSANLAKYTVLMDIQQQLNNENLVTTGFKDLTFTRYLGPDPVDSSAIPIVSPTPQGSNSGGSSTLKWFSIVTAGLAVVALLGLFGLCIYVRRKRKAAGSGIDREGKGELMVEVTELLSRSKARLKELPLAETGGDYEEVGVNQYMDDVELFHDEDCFKIEFYKEDPDRKREAADNVKPTPHLFEDTQASSSLGQTRESRPSSSRRSGSERSISSSTSSSNSRSQKQESNNRRDGNSSQRSQSRRQHDDVAERSSSSRHESGRSSSSRHESSSRYEESSRSSRPKESRFDHPSRASNKGRLDDGLSQSPIRRGVPRSVEVDFLDSDKDLSDALRESSYTSSRHSSSREASSTSHISTSDRGEGSRRSTSDRGEGPRRSNSERGDGQRRSNSERSEEQRRSNSERYYEGSQRSSSERGEGQRRSNSERYYEGSQRSSSERGEGQRRSNSERYYEGSQRSSSERTEGQRREGSQRRSNSERYEGSQRNNSDRGEGSRPSTSERTEGSSRRSTTHRRIPESLLYDDPVELAKERMAAAKSDAESRRSRRLLSSSHGESAKFDNVDIV